MENKKKLGTGALVALIVIAALNILWLVCVFISHSFSVNTLLALLMFAVAAVYALFAYKKPHGNLMRYLLLAYNAFGSALFVLLCKNQELYLIVTNVVMIFLMAYMAGRLDHYKQNVVICGIILAGTIVVFVNMLIGKSSLGTLNFVEFFSRISPITCWLAIAAGYIIRYNPHKEAGLADK